MARMSAAKRDLRKRLRKSDRRVRSSVTESELKGIDRTEDFINKMPQAIRLREAACEFAVAVGRTVLDDKDTACREANRRLLDAAVHFVRALRGEETAL